VAPRLNVKLRYLEFVMGIPWVRFSHTVPVPTHTVPVQPRVRFLRVADTGFHETRGTTSTHGVGLLKVNIIYIYIMYAYKILFNNTRG